MFFIPAFDLSKVKDYGENLVIAKTVNYIRQSIQEWTK